MPTKWKFYRALCKVDIALLIVINVLASGTAFASGSVNKNTLMLFITCVVISAVCFIVDLQTIRLVNKFSAAQNISRPFRNYLIVFYILLCPVCLAMGYILIDSVNSLYRGYFYRFDAVAISLQLLMFFLFSSYLSKLIFTWVLVKTVKENYKRTSFVINTIGANKN